MYEFTNRTSSLFLLIHPTLIMWKIKKAVLLQVCESAKGFYPNEFMCFLSGDKKTNYLNEIVLLPNTSGKDYASIWEAVIPIDDTIIASIHSHPDSSARPSTADKKFFLKYKINGIIDGTYTPEKILFYDNLSNKIELIIED